MAALRRRTAELCRFALVGGLGSLVHLGTLLGLSGAGLPLALANLGGFLLASLWGYLAHALFTFRHQTGGQRFARRWLLVQNGTNITLSVLLPGLLGSLARSVPGTAVLVLAPTVTNLLLWKLAARDVARMRRPPRVRPRLHADDLGLDPAVNAAIFRLADEGRLEGTSLLMNGPALENALDGLRRRPQLAVTLHLCLSEGRPLAPPSHVPDLLDGGGRLALGFLPLLLLSLLPPRLARVSALRRQVREEIRAQIAAFRRATGRERVALDGHQHIHLVPLVWRELLALEPPWRPCWIRTVAEPLPRGIPLRCWWGAVREGGPLKWAILRLLSLLQGPALRRSGLATNRAFAGVLFTGRMESAVLDAAWQRLSRFRPATAEDTAPLLLTHPAVGGIDPAALVDFPLSVAFFRSPWRVREFEALGRLPLAPSPAVGPGGGADSSAASG